MPFLNFGCNKAKYYSLSDMNFFLKNMKNRYSDLDPLFPNVDPRIRIHYYGKVDPSPDPIFPNVDPDLDPRQNEMDPKRWLEV